MQVYLPIAELSLNVMLLLLMGFAIGFLSGMFGVGGGFILTPLLIFLGVPPAVAVGTSASQVVAASVSGAVGHWRRNNVDLQMGLYLILGGFAGALVGVKVLSFLIARGQLEPFVAVSYVVLLGVVGTLMLIESVRVLRAAAAKAGTSMRRGAPTPGSTGCRSRCGSATPASTPASSRSWGSGLSSACSRPSWAWAAASCWCPP